MTRIVLRSIARFFRRLTRSPATLYDRWDADSEMPSGVVIREENPVSIAADNRKLRDLLGEASSLLAQLTCDRHGCEEHAVGNALADKIHTALTTIPQPSVREVEEGSVDKVAVILNPDDARALRVFLDSGFHPEHELTDEAWERIADAFAHSFAAYDGPDGDDGRDFVNAKGEPFYEP